MDLQFEGGYPPPSQYGTEPSKSDPMRQLFDSSNGVRRGANGYVAEDLMMFAPQQLPEDKDVLRMFLLNQHRDKIKQIYA